jgi:REP element-mobilizing transposase RayT
MNKPKARKYPTVYKRNLPHIQAEGRTYFITFSTFGRWILPEAVRALVLGHCLSEHQKKFRMHAAVIMPDHVHLLLSPLCDLEGSPYTLSEILGGIKGASAHSVNKALQRKGKVWQAESFDHILRNDESLRDKGEYLCGNPVRKKLVPVSDHYPWLWKEWK